MSDAENAYLQEALLHSKQLLRDKTITSSLLRIITEPGRGIEHALRSLNELFHTDAGYISFFYGGAIVSMDYQAVDPATRFAMPTDMPIPKAVFREPELRSGPSLLGDLQFASSFTYPLISASKLVGLLEIGTFKSQLNQTSFEQFCSLMQKVETTYLLVYDREIKSSQLHATRSQLLESQNRLEVIYSDSKDLLITLDRAGNIKDLNATGCNLLGYPPSQPPTTFPLISPSMDLIVTMIERTAYISDLEIVLETTSGIPVFGLASFSSAFDHHQPVIYGIVKNITERVRLQQELQTINMELSVANESLLANQGQLVQQEKMASIGELAAGVAHEINNPLAFVSSNFKILGKYFHKIMEYSESLESLIADDSLAVAELKTKFKLDHIKADAIDILSESEVGFDRIIKIIQSLKDFSRIDAAGALSIINLNDALESTINIASNSWKHVAKVEKDFKLDKSVECYASELNQVFLNIMVNAAQAIQGQKRSSPGTIWVSTAQQGEKALIRIKDDGPGMPEKVRLRIFDPFFTTKPIGQGTGLGLSISYDIIVKKHSGSLTVESSPDKGTTFTIYIPIQAAAGAEEVENAPLE